MRDKVHRDSVNGRLLRGGIVYARLAQFQEGAADDEIDDDDAPPTPDAQTPIPGNPDAGTPEPQSPEELFTAILPHGGLPTTASKPGFTSGAASAEWKTSGNSSVQ